MIDITGRIREGFARGTAKYGTRNNYNPHEFKPGDAVTIKLSDGDKKAKFVRYVSDDVAEVEERGTIGGQLFKKNERYYVDQLRKG